MDDWMRNEKPHEITMNLGEFQKIKEKLQRPLKKFQHTPYFPHHQYTLKKINRKPTHNEIFPNKYVHNYFFFFFNEK
jgi:heterodisulfide reductase subunit B